MASAVRDNVKKYQHFFIRIHYKLFVILYNMFGWNELLGFVFSKNRG